MSLQDAANLVTIQKGEEDILRDPTLSIFDKARGMEAIRNAAQQSDKKPWLTTGDLVRGAIGAGVGYGAATLFGSLLTSNPSTLKTFQNLGMGLGTLVNTGVLMNKMSADQQIDKERRHAFRYGFAKAAMDIGLIKDAGVVGTIPITEAVKAPIELATSVTGTAATTGGALLGHMFGDTSDDVDLTDMAVKQRALESKADEIESNRQQAALKRILDKRLGRK